MIISFKEWLNANETSYVRLRSDLGDVDAKRMEISIGDIVELGPETKHKGKKVDRVGKVVEIRSDTVLIKDLTRADDKRYIVPIVNLYDKEELKGRILLPSEERDLALLGGKKLWVSLTPRQYKKFKGKYKAPVMPEIIPSEPSSEPSDVLKSMFGKTSKPEVAPTLPIFDKPKAGEAQPLRRFVKKDNLDSILRRPME